jgi:hypothetical protein
MEEVFVPIKGFEELYEISNFGRIKSSSNWRKKIKGFLSPTVMKIGYYMVSLNKDKKAKKCYVHRLIAEHFIDNPNGYKFVDHIDGDKLNNSIINLRWCTKRQNETFRNSNKCKYSSKYVGVSYDKYYNKYKASTRLNNKTYNIGIYKTEEEANQAYKNFIRNNEELRVSLAHLL